MRYSTIYLVDAFCLYSSEPRACSKKLQPSWGKKPLPHIFDIENIASAILLDITYLAFERILTLVKFTLVKTLLKTLLEFMGKLLLLHSKCWTRRHSLKWITNNVRVDGELGKRWVIHLFILSIKTDKLMHKIAKLWTIMCSHGCKLITSSSTTLMLLDDRSYMNYITRKKNSGWWGAIATRHPPTLSHYGT